MLYSNVRIRLHLQLTLCLVLMANVSWTQEKFPLPGSGQKWTIQTSHFSSTPHTSVIKIGESHEWCGKVYHEIIECGGNHNCYVLGYYRIQGDSVLTRPYEFWDGTEFVDSIDCGSADDLTYDFSLTSNEIVSGAFYTLELPHTVDFWFNEVTDLEIEGYTRKVHNVSYYYEGYFRCMNWIEGIGSNKHPFYSLLCFSSGCEVSRYVSLVTRNGEVLYKSNGYFDHPSCEAMPFTSLTNTVNLSDLDIKPNPITNGSPLYVNSGVSNVRLDIYSAIGGLIRSIDIFDEGDNIINIEELDAGLYYFKFSRNDSFVVKRIVVAGN